ncbi:MAG: transcriptional regulator BolA [Idiomarinaceae bacterium HL-53]|nr:MAG: transcriptional regulator BolA [Idiomarinaceae bacterium HL-53]CUS49588.1 transcriptional regulator, BolA protein family [Idiomarinaceae bacterium HL-53]
MSTYARIEQKLIEAFDPEHLEIENESHMHASGKGAESHFKVVLVSAKFNGQRLIARHREVNKVLADEFMNGVHALALHTYTEQEWEERSGSARRSPNCMGGEQAVI